MSHLKERKEKNCLNCNAQVQGRFCHVCGQENVETKESFLHLVNHFFQDFTHFDGKFFSTLKLLIFRPGFLPREYMQGRRMSYLNPIRMYIFTSAIFFLIFFALVNPKTNMDTTPENITATQLINQLGNKKEAKQKKKATIKDSLKLNKLNQEIDTIANQIAILQKDSTKAKAIQLMIEREEMVLELSDPKFNSPEQYKKVQDSLPKNQKDGYLKYQFKLKTIAINRKFNQNPALMQEQLIEKFLHRFPQIFFISLPLFALGLQLLYNRRNQFYYVNHLIFSVFLFIFTFIISLSIILFSKIAGITGWVLFQWIANVITLYILFYQYKAMRNFYGQGRFKTILKFILLNIFSFFITILIFAVFFFFSLFQL
ncbi:MAG: DUF3667 domain-containing protein [Ferruginibacter sp.]